VADKKQVKVGIKEGGGPPPGYRWTVEFLTIAENEALKILTRQCQYEHVKDQIRELARHEDPKHSQTLRLQQVGDVWELKEKGGPLGKINLRVFYHVEQETRTIVLLGHYKKQNDGPTPPPVKRAMARRKRKYLAGEYDRRLSSGAE
jgi:mRNA-degrading endonuclease RelE of RelBE toxin-antitoxin system